MNFTVQLSLFSPHGREKKNAVVYRKGKKVAQVYLYSDCILIEFREDSDEAFRLLDAVRYDRGVMSVKRYERLRLAALKTLEADGYKPLRHYQPKSRRSEPCSSSSRRQLPLIRHSDRRAAR